MNYDKGSVKLEHTSATMITCGRITRKLELALPYHGFLPSDIVNRVPVNDFLSCVDLWGCLAFCYPLTSILLTLSQRSSLHGSWLTRSSFGRALLNASAQFERMSGELRQR